MNCGFEEQSSEWKNWKKAKDDQRQSAARRVGGNVLLEWDGRACFLFEFGCLTRTWG